MNIPKRYWLFVVAIVLGYVLAIIAGIALLLGYSGIGGLDTIIAEDNIIITLIPIIILWGIIAIVYETIRNVKIGRTIINPGNMVSMIVAAVISSFVFGIIMIPVLLLAPILIMYMTPLIFALPAGIIMLIIIFVAILATLISWGITWVIYEKLLRGVFG